MLKWSNMPWMIVATSLLAAPITFAQDAPVSSEPETESADDDAPPSLDDLLGIEGDDGEAEQATEDAAQTELDQRLNDEEVSNVFLAAVERMREVATRLEEQFDTGLGTQRAQEDVLAKLAQLMDEAQQRGAEACSSPSASSSQQQQQQQNPGKRESSEQSESDEQQNNANTPQDSSNDGQAPQGRTGELGTILEESGTEWGHLPTRIREMLLQGRRDKFSALYEQMTRDYYRRLAEEG